MWSQNFPPVGKGALLPVTTVLLAGVIFVADTMTELEIAFPAFYTAIVLLSVGFCNRQGVALVGAGCIALTLLSDLLTANAGVSQAGVINTLISLLAITSTTYLAVKIVSANVAASEARSQLAHVVRVTTLGEIAASIAHEINQPLVAAVINGNACLQWLSAQPPNFDEARQAVARLVRDTDRAAGIITQIRELAKGSTTEKDRLDINEIILATVTLIEKEIQQHDVALEMQLSNDVSFVYGDRVQLQQVILNLILNAIDAMSLVSERSRSLVVSSAKSDSNVLVSIQDSGAGFMSKDRDRLFSAFYTTKRGGMGMGLAISRSIVENHGGRIWATPNIPYGAVFHFIVPMGAKLST